VILSELRARAGAAVQRDPALIWGLVLAALVRLVLIPWFSDPLNFYGFELTGSFVAAGLNPWAQIAADPALANLNPWGYPPAFLLPTLVASSASFGDGYAFGIWIRLPLVACDLLAGVFLFRIGLAKGLSLRASRTLCLGYLFNPFVLFVSMVWGTNDPYAVLCVAGALYFLVREPKRVYLAAILLGLGASFKVYPVVIIPLAAAALPTWSQRLRLVGAAAVPAALPSLPLLLFSPHAFLATLGAFTTGVGEGGVDFHLSLWWVIQRAWGGIDAWMVGASFAAYGIALIVLAWGVARGRISLVLASTLAVIALFLVAPRFNQNYYLWAVWLIAASAALENWDRVGRRIGEWSWLPLALSAVFYNGASGVTGASYWLLVSTGLIYQPFRLLPPDALLAFQQAFYLFLAITILTLWRATRRRGEAEELAPLWPIPRVARPLGAAAVRAAVAIAVVVFVLSSAFLSAYHAPVTQDEFGEYEVKPARTTAVDDFRSLLVGFTWTVAGNGHFDVLSGDGGDLRLDTSRSGGNFHLSRFVPPRPLHIAVEVTVESLYGSPGFVQIVRVAQGWLGVMERVLSGGSTDLVVVYVDDGTGELHTLGTVTLGIPFSLEANLDAEHVLVRYAGAFAIGSSGGFVRNIHLGMVERVPGGGGSILLHRFQIDWPEQTDPAGAWVAAWLLVSTTVTLALPIAVWWRRP